jgi:uncharacterized protein
MENVMSATDQELSRQLGAPQEFAERARGWLSWALGQINAPILAIVIIPAGLWLIDPGQLYPVLMVVKNSLVKNLPFMAIAISIASATRAMGAESLVARATTQREGRMVMLFAVFGALLPFCSCGVIPVIASLLAAGVPLAPVMAFWMSSPLMDPNHFFITLGALGWEFAVARALSAVGLGLLSGYATMVLMRTVGISNPLRFRIRITGVNKYDAASAEHIRWQFWKEPARVQTFVQNWSKSFWFLVSWLTVAFLLEGLMIQYIPPATIANWLAASGQAEIPVAGLLGVIFYVNSFAAVPLVSGLIKLGLSPAAGLTFIIAGGLTSIPAATAVWVLVRPKVFIWHLVLAVVGALMVGYLYAAFLAFK